jgi:hypothetical protein
MSCEDQPDRRRGLATTPRRAGWFAMTGGCDSPSGERARDPFPDPDGISGSTPAKRPNYGNCRSGRAGSRDARRPRDFPSNPVACAAEASASSEIPIAAGWIAAGWIAAGWIAEWRG